MKQSYLTLALAVVLGATLTHGQASSNWTAAAKLKPMGSATVDPENGLKLLPGAQEDVSVEEAAPVSLKPISGSVVEAATLQPLNSVPAATSFSGLLKTSAVAEATADSTANANAGAGLIANSSTSLTEAAASNTASIQGFQTIATTSGLVAPGSNATAALAPLSGGEAITATASRASVVAGSVGALKPIPGHAVTTGSLRPLNATTSFSNGTKATSTPSLKPLGGNSTGGTVTSLQPLSSATGASDATATLASEATAIWGPASTLNMSMIGAADATSGVNGSALAASSSNSTETVVPASVAGSMALPLTFVVSVAGFVGFFLI